MGPAGVPRSSIVSKIVSKWFQNYIPKNLQEVALGAKHTTASRQGVNKTLGTLRARCYWPGLTSSVKKWFRAGHECRAKKSTSEKRRSL